jgi:hypothetical protein
VARLLEAEISMEKVGDGSDGLVALDDFSLTICCIRGE